MHGQQNIKFITIYLNSAFFLRKHFVYTSQERERGDKPITLPLYTYSPVAVLKSHISVVHVSRTNAEEESNRLHLSTLAAIVGKCCFSFSLC